MVWVESTPSGGSVLMVTGWLSRSLIVGGLWLAPRATLEPSINASQAAAPATRHPVSEAVTAEPLAWCWRRGRKSRPARSAPAVDRPRCAASGPPEREWQAPAGTDFAARKRRRAAAALDPGARAPRPRAAHSRRCRPASLGAPAPPAPRASAFPAAPLR